MLASHNFRSNLSSGYLYHRTFVRSEYNFRFSSHLEKFKRIIKNDIGNLLACTHILKKNMHVFQRKHENFKQLPLGRNEKAAFEKK